MRICGVDPGLGTTGYAVIDADSHRVQVIDAGVIRSSVRQSFPERLNEIHNEFLEMLRETQPEVVVVESLYSHYRHPRTAIQMGHVRGVLMQAATGQDIPVHEYSATHVKRLLTGNGRAAKPQIQRVIVAYLGLSHLPEPHDVADALAIALCETRRCSVGGHRPIGTSQARPIRRAVS